MNDQADPIYAEIMRRIHGANIYVAFQPTFAEDRQGWNSEHPIFDEIIRAVRPRVVVDVGVWKGASTIHLAGLMKRHAISGAVVAVDTFLGSLEHADQRSPVAGLITRRFGMPQLYEQFLSNVVRCGAQDRIVPLAQTSTTAAQLLRLVGVQAGLVHIDASHDQDDVLRDARAYWQLLAPGGFMVGDDYNDVWPGVVKAANQFAYETAQPLMVSAPKWIIRRPA